MKNVGDLQNYIKQLSENEVNQLYNLANPQLIPHLIQFQQLIAYCNFKHQLKDKMTNSNFKIENQKEIYLIDKDWLKKWKIHVGYKEIKNFVNQFKKNDYLNEKDYDWIEPIINNNCQNLLSPLDNSKIYDNKNKNALNLYSKYTIVDKYCFYLFSLGSKQAENPIINNGYQIIIYFNKLILIIDDIKNLLKFKITEKKYKFELLIIFQKEKINRETFFMELEKIDINEWIKNIKFDLYKTEKMDLNNFTIINKTLISKKIEGGNFGKKIVMEQSVMNVTFLLPEQLQKEIMMKKPYLNNQINNNTVISKPKPNLEQKYNDDSSITKIFLNENGFKPINNNNENDLAAKTIVNNNPNKNNNKRISKYTETQMSLDSRTFNLSNNINDHQNTIYYYPTPTKVYSKRNITNQNKIKNLNPNTTNNIIINNINNNFFNNNINTNNNNNFNNFDSNSYNNGMNNFMNNNCINNVPNQNNKIFQSMNNICCPNLNNQMSFDFNPNNSNFNNNNINNNFNNLNNNFNNCNNNSNFNIDFNNNNNFNNLNNIYNDQSNTSNMIMNNNMNCGDNMNNMIMNNNINCNNMCNNMNIGDNTNNMNNIMNYNNMNNNKINNMNTNNDQFINMNNNKINNMNTNNDQLSNMNGNQYNNMNMNNNQIINTNNNNNQFNNMNNNQIINTNMNNNQFSNMNGMNNINTGNNMNNMNINNMCQIMNMNNNNCNLIQNNMNFGNNNIISNMMMGNNMNNFNSNNMMNNMNMLSNFNMSNFNNNMMNKFNMDFFSRSEQGLINQMNSNFNSFGFNNNEINNLNPGTITKFKPKPHKIGLQNIGQTCYMNASLQCLTNIMSLSNQLILMFKNNMLNLKQYPLTFVYSQLLFEFQTTSKTYIVPTNFKKTLEVLNPLFQGNQASDAKDFIFFIIERLHQELKPPDNPQNDFGQIDFLQQEIQARNQMLTLINFLNELNTKNTSIVSKTFYGITRSIMRCEGCYNEKYSFQTFNIINFILKKVKDDKKQLLGEYLDNDYVINLMDAFESDYKQENLTGENMIYCNNCKSLQNGWMKQNIYQLPSIMIIVLNRGKNNKDFREQFKIDEILNFANNPNILCNVNNQKTYKKYFLCGVITHLGESGSNGHFISYYRNGMNQKFFCYNDASVAEVSVEDAIKTKISYNESEDIIPYILFYHYHN